MTRHRHDDGLLLPGLDGTNPLGFLAALGVLRLFSLHTPSVKLFWQVSGGTWRPSLVGVNLSLTEIGSELHAVIHNLDLAVWSIDKELPFKATRLQEHARHRVSHSSRHDRIPLDTIAAFGSDCIQGSKNTKNEEDNKFESTSLRLVRNRDNQGHGLLSYAVRTLELCSKDQLQNAVAATWLYQDEKLSFRWDPVENRGYALQWDDPSKVGAMTERGANCLALFGMSFFPVIPVRGSAETTGFGLVERKQSSLTWPIWSSPISLRVAQSILTWPQLQAEKPNRLELGSRAIAAVYRSDRVMTSTYYANFTPAKKVA